MKRKRLKTFVVYMAVNQITGRRYIGATSVGLPLRRQDHVRAALKGSDASKKFYRAIRKYGPGSFNWLVLVTAPAVEEMFAAEIRLIAQLKPELNLTKGGEGIVGWKRTKSWRKKVSDKQKGKPVSAACIEAYYKAGYKNFFKAVVCLNDGKFFETISRAAKHYGLPDGGVRGVANGHACFCKGYSFVLSKGPLPEDQRLSLLTAMKAKVKAGHLKSKDWKRRAVICVDDGKQYAQASVAAEAYGLSGNDIRRRCFDKKSTKTSLAFRFLD